MSRTLMYRLICEGDGTLAPIKTLAIKTNVLFHVLLTSHNGVLPDLKAHLSRSIIHKATKRRMSIAVILWRVPAVSISILRL